MKKILLTFICVMSVILPSLGDISVDNNAPTCDESTIGATSDSANLQAQWSANTINLKWYNGNEELTVENDAKTCSYDGAITLPETEPTKPGYTFAGWKVKLCGLTVVDTSINGTDYGWVRLNNRNNRNTSKYGLTDAGQWATEFEHGVVKGTAKCETDGIGSGYCWCKLTSYIKNGISQCIIDNGDWVYRGNDGSFGDCMSVCAPRCSIYIYEDVTFRQTLFGQAN